MGCSEGITLGGMPLLQFGVLLPFPFEIFQIYLPGVAAEQTFPNYPFAAININLTRYNQEWLPYRQYNTEQGRFKHLEDGGF